MAFTFFFRDKQTHDTIIEHFIHKVIGQSKIQIWDPGCATGEEPYTFAILLAEKMGQFAYKNVKICATDINPEFEKIIHKGRYPYKLLQRIPKDLFEKYFKPVKDDDEHFDLIYKIKNRVNFRLNDLRDLKPIEGKNSLIICKNVLLHQKPEERIEILKMFHESLTPNGFLAVENTQQIPDKIKHLFKPVTSNAQVFIKA